MNEREPRTVGRCHACDYEELTDLAGTHAVGEFLQRGWQSVPRRRDGSGGYWLCPSCREDV